MKTINKNLCVLVILIVSVSTNVNAQVVLPNFFADNMVLQHNTLIPVWGTASVNEKIEIRFNKQLKRTKVDKSGKWIVRLDAETAGGPYELIIKGKTTIQIKNVLVGEVWLCGGQSNMEFPVGSTGGWQGGVQNFKSEVAAANYPQIRQIKIQNEINSLPNSDVITDGWVVCDPTTVSSFSAVGYFFAKNIYDSLKIPIGLINDCWGGTNIETWISREAFEGSDEFKEMISKMPKVNLDSLSSLVIKNSRLRIEALQGAKLNELKTSHFNQLTFDDTKWPSIIQPQLWESQSIGELDGVVWVRKTISLTASDIKKNAVLELAKIDDYDVTYVNGVKVGKTDSWDLDRRYVIEPGILVEGKNVIAIRIVDTGGGGGIYGELENLNLNLGDSKIALAGDWKFQVESIQKQTNQNSLPSLCYNAMISPLIPFAFRGVIWYQGESNAGRSFQYRKAFPLLINDWRQKWNNPNMPFYFVQLATFNTSGNSNEGCGWAELREAQTMTLSLPNTGMCVTTDVGNPTDVHPTNKQTVGKRLAALALKGVYQKELVCSGPTFKSMEINGKQIVLSFDNIGSGLYTPDKYGYIKGFEIAGKDQVFYYAKAYIKGNSVIVYNDTIENPIAVHFGWIGDASDNNLFNNEGFPAVPFRTDQWKTITKDEKYPLLND